MMIVRRSFNIKIKKILFLLAVAVAVNVGQASAQDDDPGLTDTGDPDGVPIDGGLSVLLAAGAVAGARKIYVLNKKQEQELS